MSTFLWGTVTAVGPVRVQLDGDTAALPFTLDSLIDPLVLVVNDRVRCEMSGNRVVVHGRAEGESEPVGSLKAFTGRSVPPGAPYLVGNGAAVSRVTYARLFEYLCESLGTVTVTIATPAVITRNSHGLVAGDKVYFTTTGALPTGLSANTIYYVLATGLTTNTFRVSATDGGAAVNTSGTQSGAHTMRFCPYGLGNGSTTFNLPDYGDYVLVGQKAGSAEFPSVGRAFGAKTHTLTTPETPSHTHTNANTGQAAPAGTAGANGSIFGYGTAGDLASRPVTISATGGGGAHNNVQPSRSVLWCIRF